MKRVISLAIITTIGLSFIGCGGGSDDSEQDWNTDFEKFNKNLLLLDNDATHPTETNPTLFNEDDWIISKKKGTSFYISELASTEQLLSYDEAKSFCSNLAIDSEALNWRIPTNNELLIISELNNPDAFFWSSDITTVWGVDNHDSVNLKEKFICQSQWVYDVKTQEGSLQQYCNETLSGKYGACVANTTN